MKSLCRSAETMKRLGQIVLALGLIVILASVMYAGGGPNVSGAKLYIQQNQLERAFEVLNKEINEVNPNNEDAWYLLGYIYARQGQYDKMKEAFDKAVALKPQLKDKGIKISKDSGRAFLSEFGVEMITRIVWSNLFNEAVKSFNEASGASDEAARTAGYEKAIEEFRLTTVIVPDSASAYRNMAAAMLNLGRYEDCIEPLTQAIALQPKDAESRLLLAQIYMTINKDSLAAPIIEKLWGEGYRTEEVAENYARMLIRAGKIDEAKGIYKEAIAANPNNYQFRYNYGTILLEANDYDAAIEQLQKAFDLDSSSADINYNLGAAYLNRGVAYREKLPADSEDTFYLKDFERAFPFLERSVKLNPDDQQIWATLGRIAGQLNKIALAGYAFAKSDNLRSAFDQKVIVGMPSDAVLTILGEPVKKSVIESNQFTGIEEWIYNQRPKAAGKIAIPAPLRIYILNGRVDAISVES